MSIVDGLGSDNDNSIDFGGAVLRQLFPAMEVMPAMAIAA